MHQFTVKDLRNYGNAGKSASTTDVITWRINCNVMNNEVQKSYMFCIY